LRHTDTNTYCDANGNADSDSHGYSDPNIWLYFNTDAICVCDIYSYTYAYCYSNRYGDTNVNTSIDTYTKDKSEPENSTHASAATGGASCYCRDDWHPSSQANTRATSHSGAVGPGFAFTPSNVYVPVGAIVRWTWAGGGHSVTSGVLCTADGQFCSPDDMNCQAGTLSNIGAVYEHIFTQAGAYPYFCFAHCASGMTGVVVVVPPPPPGPRPTPAPRP